LVGITGEEHFELRGRKPARAIAARGGEGTLALLPGRRYVAPGPSQWEELYLCTLCPPTVHDTTGRALGRILIIIIIITVIIIIRNNDNNNNKKKKKEKAVPLQLAPRTIISRMSLLPRSLLL
jgi:hypothetical protein